jgi:hypothetical protein
MHVSKQNFMFPACQEIKSCQYIYNIRLCVALQVTWVEHVEVDDRSVHNLYRPLVNSGLGFGATRWVGTLDRQCERLASAMASNIPNGDLGGK